MPPNAKAFFVPIEHEAELIVKDVKSNDNKLLELLDQQADTSGLQSVSGAEDWTDVKHSERKKRDRILDDGILFELMKKSDFKGFERLTINLSIMALTAFAIHKLDVYSKLEYILQGTDTALEYISENPARVLALVIVYFFYGFQFQCFAFAGQYDFLHRNAFKTKIYNDICLFLTGVFCFELGAHERVMHKQHHTYTNNTDKDPELTSYFSREQLESPGFRNVPFSRYGYFKQYLDIFTTFKCRVGRIIMSALGIPVDYSGTGWSLKNFNYGSESGIMRTLQKTAISQLMAYAAILYIKGQSKDGIQSLLFWWIVPVLLGYPAVNYFRNLEHADCEVSKDPNCLRNTRTVSSNIIIRTLLWDTNYHAEHHCYPWFHFSISTRSMST